MRVVEIQTLVLVTVPNSPAMKMRSPTAMEATVYPRVSELDPPVMALVQLLLLRVGDICWAIKLALT